MKRAQRLILLASAALLAGCSSIGPDVVTRDRFDYNTAISDSWKQQTLLNIVRLRYADMPVFVEVASVVGSYQLEGTVALSGRATSPTNDFLNLGTTGKYIDRPTITYQPITGQKFNRSFMTPIPPGAILFLLQSGWPARLVLPLTVDAINGLRSEQATGINQRPGDADYYRVIDLLQELQQTGALGMSIKKQGELATTLLLFYRDNISEEVSLSVEELYRTLKLDRDAREFQVVYGNLPKEPSEIALATFSMLQILIRFAGFMEVPPEDVASGATLAAKVTDSRRPVTIRQSDEQPPDAFVATRYRNRWFWIADGDFGSKRVFTFLMILLSLMETGGSEGLPLVTIPTG